MTDDDGKQIPGRDDPPASAQPARFTVLAGGREALERRWLSLFVQSWVEKTPEVMARLDAARRALMPAANGGLKLVEPPTAGDSSDETS